MSRVVVIGATGHIGTYLVPRLVDGGHEVIAVSRGGREPYHPKPQWNAVTRVTADRDAEDAAGTFGARIAALRPDVVIDPHLLHRPLGGPARRRAAPVPSAAGALRHDLGARPGAAGANHRGRAADSLRRVRHRQGRDRGPAAPRDTGGRRPCGDPAPRSHQRSGLARDYACLYLDPWRSGPTWRRVSRWRCPTAGSVSCTTCTPTTWRRPSNSRCPGRP